MKKFQFRPVVLFFLLVFLQVWLFNSIHLFDVATPLLYIYFLIKLPANMNRNMVLFLSALMGLSIDIFEYTLGLNMLAMTVAGFFRYYFLKLFAPKDVFDEFIPSISTLGKWVFLRYVGTLALIHVLLLFSIESLSLFDPLLLFLRIVSSFVLTILIIFAFENLNFDLFKK
ncbi:rod shape-determining protein MreD [Bacteroidia bacterium]|nr:rod shape-determining protein MreD [Bacteroidia bacterium]